MSYLIDVGDVVISTPTREGFDEWDKVRNPEPKQLTIEERDLLEAEVRAADTEATEEAIYQLIQVHMAEFEEYLKVARRKRGIDNQVQTGWKSYLDNLQERI